MEISEPGKELDVLTDCFFGIYGYWDNTPEGLTMLGLSVDPPAPWRRERREFVKRRLEPYLRDLSDPFTKRLLAYLPSDRWYRLPSGLRARRTS